MAAIGLRAVPPGLVAFAALGLAWGRPVPALAWGDTGHRWIGELAMEALPAGLPGFLATAEARAEVGELAREPDRSRGAGRTHDQDRDPAHFVDGDEAGRVLGGPPLDRLPATRAEYEKALQAVNADSWKAGYLPYAIVEGWQQLVKDFAYWRAAAYGERAAEDPRRRAWLKADRERRERLALHDLGMLAHFVGDASQPLHLTLHYDGWGRGPNPEGYTTRRIHVALEGPFVTRWVRREAVQAQMRPFRSCRCGIGQRVGAYLSAEARQVAPLYALEKAGGFRDGDARGPAFMAARLAEGAAELRDLVAEAWNASGKMAVGYPGVPAADVEAGKAGDAYDLLRGPE